MNSGDEDRESEYSDPPLRRRSRLVKHFPLLVVLLIPPAFWIFLAPWPEPVADPITGIPDAIIVLGGADLGRIREAARLAYLYPTTPLIISGDEGYLADGILASGVPPGRILLEPNATSTWENADRIADTLDRHQAKRIVLVTNWFHVPRARAVFRARFPEREVFASFEPPAHPQPPWDRAGTRRERIVALYYLLRHGVWSF